jgi:hypothetical protein
MLQAVANGLGDLKDKVVFVGGAVAELYRMVLPIRLKRDCQMELTYTYFRSSII